LYEQGVCCAPEPMLTNFETISKKHTALRCVFSKTNVRDQLVRSRHFVSLSPNYCWLFYVG